VGLPLELVWCDAEVGGDGTGMESSVPHRHHQVGIFDGQGAGQVNGVGASKSMETRQPARAPLDSWSELDRSGGCPVLLPDVLGQRQAALVKVVIPSSSECSSHLGVSDPARDRRVAAIPQIGCQLGADLFDHQLDEGAGIEIGERHGSATLLADQLRH